jgi:uncharacterized protein (TIGR02118 family)
MADKPVINIVGTQCTPADEAKFNQWYNEVHIPMLLKYPGLKGVARYKVIDESSKQPKYIAVYRYASRKDMEGMGSSPAFAAAIKEMQESWGQKIEITSRLQYELIKDWNK